MGMESQSLLNHSYLYKHTHLHTFRYKYINIKSYVHGPNECKYWRQMYNSDSIPVWSKYEHILTNHMTLKNGDQTGFKQQCILFQYTLFTMGPSW